MLNIIYGASGVGKSRFIESIDLVPNFELITKGTTRSKKALDGKELEHISTLEELREQYDAFVFPYFKDDNPKYWFGIKTIDLVRSTEKSRINYFLFCNHLETIRTICRKYENTRTFFFQIDNYVQLFEQESDREHNPKDRIERMDNLHKAIIECNGMSLFDGVILYKVRRMGEEHLSNKEVRRQLFNLISDEQECREYRQAISKTIAVMMPQGERRFEQIHYNAVFDVISKRVETKGFKAKRVTDASDMIMKDVIETIDSSNMVIVDLSQSRTNCYFEAGYAKGMNKNCLFICDQATPIGYDTSAYNVRRYDLESNEAELIQIIDSFIDRSNN